MVNLGADQQIIFADLWDAVKARQAEARAARDKQFHITNNPLAETKRPGHLLSDLVFCGVYCVKFVAAGGGCCRYRNRCGAGCGNGSITTVRLESRALSGARERLLSPSLISRSGAEPQKELNHAPHDIDASPFAVEVTLADTRSRVAKLVHRMEEYDEVPNALIGRLKQLKQVETQLSADLVTTSERKVIRRPANYAAVYIKAVAELKAHLPGVEGTATRQAIRALVERVVVQVGNAHCGKSRAM